MNIDSCSSKDLRRAQASIRTIKSFLKKFESGKDVVYPSGAVLDIENVLEDNYEKELSLINFIETQGFNPEKVLIKSIRPILNNEKESKDNEDIFLFSEEDGFQEEWTQLEFLVRTMTYLLYNRYINQVKDLEEITNFTEVTKERVTRILGELENIYSPIKQKLEGEKRINKLKGFYSKPEELSEEEKSKIGEMKRNKDSIRVSQMRNSYRDRENEAYEINKLGNTIEEGSSPRLYAAWLLTAASVCDIEKIDKELKENILKKILGSINETNHISLLNTLGSIPYVFKDDSWEEGHSKESRNIKLPKWRVEWNPIKDRIFDIFENVDKIGTKEKIISDISIRAFIKSIYFWGWDKDQKSIDFLDKYEDKMSLILKREAKQVEDGHHYSTSNYKQKETFLKQITRQFPEWVCVEEEVYIKGLSLDYKVLLPNGKIIYIEYDGQNHFSNERESSNENIQATAKTLRKTLYTDKQNADLTVFRVPYYNIVETLKSIGREVGKNN